MQKTALLAVLTLSACTTTSGKDSVDYQMVLPPGAEQMVMPENEVFLMPSTLKNPLPNYPEISTRNRDIKVCAEIVISTTGLVSQVTPLFDLPECPGAEKEIEPPFILAVKEALSSWTFSPAVVCVFPPHSATDDECNGDGVAKQPVSIKLAYVFTFESKTKKARAAEFRPM